MVDNPLKQPVFLAALGAAAGFYGLPLAGLGTDRAIAIIWLLGAVLVSLCAVQVIVSSRKMLFYPGKNNRNPELFRICLFALAFGAVLGVSSSHIAAGRKTVYGLPPEKVRGACGRLLDDPHLLANGNGAFSLDLISVKGKDGLEAGASGPVQVFLPGELLLAVKGQGRGSRVFLDGSFSFMQKSGGMYFRARSVHVSENPSQLQRFRTGIRLRIITLFEQKKWGPLALALLFGVRDTLDSALADNYRNAGCSHVLALSGMHLGIISAIAAFLLKKPLGLHRAAVFGALFIIAYVVLVGAQPSLLRSAIMSVLGSFALIRGYRKNALPLLALTFLVQIILFPVSAHSLSFILSYLALAGIVLASPVFLEFLKGWMPDCAASPLAASLSAFLFTAPVCALYFSTLRPIGIPAGLFIVPLSSLFMVFSLAWFAVSAVPFLEAPLGKIPELLYNILEILVAEAGKVPGIGITNIPVFSCLCLAIGVLVFLFYKKIRNVRTSFAPFA